jgi:hypothetical protein
MDRQVFGFELDSAQHELQAGPKLIEGAFAAFLFLRLMIRCFFLALIDFRTLCCNNRVIVKHE